MMLIRLSGACVSRGGYGPLSILIFHRVLPMVDPLFPDEWDAQRFDAALSWLVRGFNVLPLDQAITALREGRLPSNAVAITFDDGYADNYTVALPILKKHGLNATFFVATGFLNGGRMFNDTVIEALRLFQGDRLDLTGLGLGVVDTRTPSARRSAIDALLPALKYLPSEERAAKAAAIARLASVDPPADLMMTSFQLRELRAAGMNVGGHTVSHPILARLDDIAAYAEIAEGKRRLEAILGESISLFAYPNGRPDKDYLRKHAVMVREAGYFGAVTTSPGAARRGADNFQLPRFTPWDRTEFRFGLRLIVNMRKRGRGAA